MAGYDAIQGSLAVAVPRHAKPSFIAVGFMVMLGDAVRGIFFPTLWPLVSSLGGTRSSMGVIVAAFRATKGPVAREDFLCTMRATSSLPEPDGPRIMMRLLVGATLSMV